MSLIKKVRLRALRVDSLQCKVSLNEKWWINKILKWLYLCFQLKPTDSKLRSWDCIKQGLKRNYVIVNTAIE